MIAEERTIPAPLEAPADGVPLYPFPEGWYFVTSRKAILKAKLIQKTWMGENIIAWCDIEGRVCVAEARCPHLGADLRPEAGGSVRNGRLVCPFHGFSYDASGQCVATPFADPPQGARLRVFETEEVCGLIFAWWGIGGRSPRWQLHPEPPDEEGWSNHAIRTLRFPGHPQETTENSVDLAHLRYVHGYGGVERTGRVLTNGAHCTSSFDFRSPRRIGRFGRVTLDISSTTFISGLGYSFVDIHERSIGMHLRMWVLATPIDGTLIDMTLASQAYAIRGPKRRIVGLGFLPPRLRAPVMNKLVARWQEGDVMQDVVIWGHKHFLPKPELCRSDGEIRLFRKYCAQFYPEQSDSKGALRIRPSRATGRGPY